MRIDFYHSPGCTAISWPFILINLKEESGLSFYDGEFEKWVAKEWDIKILHTNEVYPDHISGMEFNEQTLTMLMLKWPKAFS